MNGIKRRLIKLESHQGGLSADWLKRASIEELEARLRKLLAKSLGCEPDEINLTDSELQALITRGGQTH